ncbi:fimbrial protein [Serratia rhizosphaerae]|uniref:fimbrial protein n=1 Tax=unclassified Serratia (in: enterobacteria) TaxID=2647522 RepID=UPI000DA2C758|nr:MULTISPECIES: fimbrial protein [unclassified Serratia (in: enterobacteria)]MBU3894505.1 fimbrial protein [Serratia rubidaea]CAE1149501.1 Fimbrial protein [Serratia sp. Tan611]SQJ09500.1 long polar fimbrial protein LpfD [Serratia rubidaea]
MKFSNLFKRLPLLTTFTVGIFAAPSLLAAPAPGTCENTSDGTTEYPFSFDRKFDSPDQNVGGQFFRNIYEWNLNKSYIANCGCSRMREAFFTAKSTLPEDIGVSDGENPGLQYFKLNDFLSVASEVYIAGRERSYFKVPFNQIGNKNSQAADEVACNATKNTYKSGSIGKVHIYFRRPFVGTQVIPPTRLLEVYMTSSRDAISALPVSYVMMSGTVTVDQQCVLNGLGAGQPISINFGNIMSTEFKTKGAMPKEFTPHRKELRLACNNISDGVKVNLSFHGEPDPNVSTALKTDSNPDVAVRIDDPMGTPISPAGGRLPINMNFGTTEQTGSTEITVYPINTTGELPKVGVFNSSATIKVNIE